MKNFSQILINLFLLGMWLLPIPADGQRLHAVSAAHDSIWAIDTTNWAISQRLPVTMTGATVTGVPGLTYDPIGHDAFCLLATTAQPNASILAKINVNSGVCTQVGTLNQVFSSIGLRDDGQLLGVVADGQPNAEKLYLIDKTNGTTTLATTLGNGDDGEVLAFHHEDEQLYHWSGSSQRIMERLPGIAPFGPTANILTSGAANSRISAAVYLGDDKFLLGNSANGLQYAQSSGFYQPNLTTLPFEPNGLIFMPHFALSDDFFCVFDTISWNFDGIALDTAVYDWGDGFVESVFPAASASHAYTIPGNYVTTASLKNPTSGLDQIGTRNIQVKPLPPVNLLPSTDTILCLADTLMVTGSFGGTSQWYRNGNTIPGANSNVHFATQSGWYNMTKRNQNGCIDSAAIGISIVFATQTPNPSISVDTSNCPTLLFAANDPIGTSWNWQFGDGANGIGSNPTHTYSSVGTFNVSLTASNGCYSATSSATAIVDCFIGAPESQAPKILILPNPNNGKFRLHVKLPSATELTFAVLDANGRVILNETHPQVAGECTFDINLKLSAGIYLLRWQASEYAGIQRIVVQ